jgi:branched-chain amino acid transport system substrate-binding protein
MSRHRSRRLSVGLVALVALIATACSPGNPPTATAPSVTGGEIRIGAVFPLAGNAAGLASQELAGVRAAVDFVNADGGIAGRRISIDVRDLEAPDQAATVMADLKAAGAVAVVGAYSSALSIRASQAASDAGLVYWEAGAVADRLTGRGLPLVFRVGASGTNLGANSASFAATQLAPRLGRTVRELRIAIVAADDDYARSVAAAAASTAARAGAPIVADLGYDLNLPEWPAVMARLADARPDVVILASHIPDGIAFRRAMLGAGLRVGALIGSTMAECDPDFAGDLGPDAVGIFASDRPIGGFQPSALDPTARALYDRFAAAWAARAGGSPGVGSPGPGAGGYGGYGSDRYGSGSAGSPAASPGDGAYTINGPVEGGTAASGPSEEGLSGFAAAWALFHDVLPLAAGTGSIDPSGIAAAARTLDLPNGALPNGAGLRFSSDPATLGQNERAAAVIWQWQAVRSYTFVWPPTYRTGEIGFVPLER